MSGTRLGLEKKIMLDSADQFLAASAEPSRLSHAARISRVNFPWRWKEQANVRSAMRHESRRGRGLHARPRGGLHHGIFF
jgi:hypothetical protein